MSNCDVVGGEVPLCAVNDAARTGVVRWYARGNAAALAAVVLAIVVATAARVVDDRLVLLGCPLPDTCMSKVLLGRPCIGCGLTRSVVLAVAGQWTPSRACHPAGIWLAAWLVAQVVVRTSLVLIRPRRPLAWQADIVLSLGSLFAVLYVPLIAARF